MTITWPQLAAALSTIAVGVGAILRWLAAREVKRSDACEARVAALEASVSALQAQRLEDHRTIFREAVAAINGVTEALRDLGSRP